MLPPTILPRFPHGYEERAPDITGAAIGGALVEWNQGNPSPLREYVEVVCVIAGVTITGCLFPLSYRTFGYIYLLTVILLGLRVGRGPTLMAVVGSALVWNFLFIPPRFSMRILDRDDAIHLGAYLMVALIAGHLTTRIRARERQGRLREQQATALLHLTRAVAGAGSVKEAVDAALRQAEHILGASTAMLLTGAQGLLEPCSGGSMLLPDAERSFAESVRQNAQAAGRPTVVLSPGGLWHLPLLRSGVGFGVFVVGLPVHTDSLGAGLQALLEGLAEQISLIIEREQLRPSSGSDAAFGESNRLHCVLLNSVSHELKSPLSILRSAGEKLEAGDTLRQTSLIKEIRSATRRIDHLVGNLLSQTRLQSGVLKPQLDWCVVKDILDTARRSLDNSLSGHPLRVDIPRDMPLIMADAPLMEHVFSNLLLNAALHTPNGCPIEVSTGLDESQGHRRVFIRISDRGPGLPPELQDDPFQQFRRGASARPGGLGLGLSIVRGFVQAQGGDVVAENNPGGGARFTITLPHAEPQGVPSDEE